MTHSHHARLSARSHDTSHPRARHTARARRPRAALSGTLRAHLRWTILEIHRSSLVDFLRMCCGDPSLADDLSQETFLRALGSGTPIERLQQPESWLKQVARNVTRDHHRREFARPVSAQELPPEELLESPESPPGMPPPATLLDVAGVQRDRETLVLVLFRVWNELSLRDRRVLLAFYFQGQGVVALSRRFGARSETVRVWLYRARKRLRRRLERHVANESAASYDAAALVDRLPRACAEPPAPEWRG